MFSKSNLVQKKEAKLKYIEHVSEPVTSDKRIKLGLFDNYPYDLIYKVV